MSITDEDKLPLVITLDDLVNASAGDKDWVITLIDEAVISPEPDDMAGSMVYFNSLQLTRVRRAFRLRRDFDASPQAIGLILALLDELHGLRQLQHQYQTMQARFDID